MSFLTDLFSGNTGNLSNDLSPSNIFSDTTKDIGGKNTIPELLGGAALVGGGFALAPELFGGGAAAADAGATAAGAYDLSGLGLTSDAAALPLDASVAANSAILPANATLDSLNLGGDVLTTPWSAGGVGPIGGPPPIGAATAALPGADTLSVPGFADATVSGGDITNFAGTDSSTAASSGSFWDKLVGGAESSLTKNPLGIAAATGALGLDILKGNKTDPNQQALQNEAPQMLAQGGALTASGTQLQTYLTNGTLPPALQSQVTSAVAAEKARIIQNHASNGENTNPTQNSALAQELSQADMNGLNLAGQLEQQLFTSGTQLITTGLNETGLSTQLYETLARMDQTNNNQIMAAIASMAAALGGGTKISIGSNSIATG